MMSSVASRSCSLVPGVVASFGRGSFVHSVADSPKIALSKHSNLTFYHLSSSRSFCCTSTFKARSRSARLQCTSSQAVTTDSDSNGADAVGSSDRAINLSSAFSKEDLKPFFVSSLHGLQEGIRNLKERGLVQSSKEGFKEAYSKIKTVDGKAVLQDVSRSQILKQGGRVWQTLKPWIKFPLAIFAVVFLVVFASCGLIVAQDLIPLWIIGPLITGLIIRSAYVAADVAQKSFTSTESLRQAGVECAVQLYEDAKNGELFDKLRIGAESKSNELKQVIAKKWSDFVLYVKSGQAATDLKIFLLLKFSQFSDWSTEKYEDFAEWVRPFWRAFTRLMKRLF